jgi:hypothetical protein
MRLTIVVDDKNVGVDGVFYNVSNFPQIEETIHAVQWYDNYGEVEYKTRFESGALVKPANLLITDVTPYQAFVDIWNVLHEEALTATATPTSSDTPLIPSVEF